MSRKLTKAELTLKRIARKDDYPAPAWGDHVLNGEQRRTTASKLSK